MGRPIARIWSLSCRPANRNTKLFIALVQPSDSIPTKKLGYYKTTTLLLYFPVYTTLVFVRFAHISTHPPFFIDLFISQSKKKVKNKLISLPKKKKKKKTLPKQKKKKKKKKKS